MFASEDRDTPENLRCLLTVNLLGKPEFPYQVHVYSNINEFNSNLLMAKWLLKASNETGNHVQLQPEYGFCPMLVGNDSTPVLLYRFVEVLEELIDYTDVKDELPTLTIGQISGAVSYLRKLAQFNTRGVDIDALEDEALAHDDSFLSDLREALADEEAARVLDFRK
jgi:hypothetical protein